MNTQRQLKAKCANEKWINIGVINLHHCLFSKNVCSKENIETYPRFETLKSVYVNGFMMNISEPKFEMSAIQIEINIIGTCKLLILINLFFRNI